MPRHEPHPADAGGAAGRAGARGRPCHPDRLGRPGAPAPRGVPYLAAKAAQHSLTECWARALGPYGVTVNTVASGWVPVDRGWDGERARTHQGAR
ncbi:SDR family NAD(P)-dependent oxidoreductase [Streptomyces buecherae]|uniref:SDR family NAD(P)-dependent oxidoreductase n=1 Tax=Streptomyces buecherae TaxID=2763006 RepID=UPI0037B006FB